MLARGGKKYLVGTVELKGAIDFHLAERGTHRNQLLSQVWGGDHDVDERTVDVHIGRLRKLLNPGREQDPIRTVRGAGYALDDRFAKAE